MAIKIVVSNKVGFKVKGETNDENGKSQPFEFSLTALRFDEEKMNATQAEVLIEVGKTGNHAHIANLLCGTPEDPDSAIVTNWSGVKGEDDSPLAFTPALLRQLINSTRGLGTLIWRTYLNESGAKEKN